MKTAKEHFEEIDYFDQWEGHPEEVTQILERYQQDDICTDANELRSELDAIGWTFDVDAESMPHDLRIKDRILKDVLDKRNGHYVHALEVESVEEVSLLIDQLVEEFTGVYNAAEIRDFCTSFEIYVLNDANDYVDIEKMTEKALQDHLGAEE